MQFILLKEVKNPSNAHEDFAIQRQKIRLCSCGVLTMIFLLT